MSEKQQEQRAKTSGRIGKPLKELIEIELQQNKIGFSFEVFPPKTEATKAKFSRVLENLCMLKPAFIDVTYGAGGSSSTRETTFEICTEIQSKFGIPSVPHITCRGCSEETMHTVMKSVISHGISNVLALRGDAFEQNEPKSTENKFNYASDLIKFIRLHYGDCNKIGISVAGYPEKHPESLNSGDDIEHLEEKLKIGSCDCCITQFFLDPMKFLEFRDKLKPNTTKVVPGIIMINSYSGFKRMISLSGSSIFVPKFIIDELEKLKNDQLEIQAFGVKLAIDICRVLFQVGRVDFFHIFTLNIDSTVKKVVETLRSSITSEPEYIHSIKLCDNKKKEQQQQQQQQE